ncbi:MAG: carbohydrate kinase [Ilumatobacter sp.]|nr:carbohydrate kinase [Ilumatobacter sp.]
MLLVVGEALVDLVIAPDGSVESALGGAPFNAARAAALLGADVEFCGVLSHDRFGTLLADRLEADGVGVSSAPRTEAPTTLAAAELDDTGAAVYRFYVEQTAAPSLASIDTARPPDVLLTGGLALALTPIADTIADGLATVPADTLVMIDVNCRPTVIADRGAYRARLDAMLGRADIVKVSDDDLDYLEPSLPTIAAAQQLLDAGPSAILVTAGSKSTTVLTPDGQLDVTVPPLAAPVIDTIGAGDTFTGALLAWWEQAGFGRAHVDLSSIARAVDAAHAAAAVVVTRRGADPPGRSDLATDWAPRRD